MHRYGYGCELNRQAVRYDPCPQPSNALCCQVMMFTRHCVCVCMSWDSPVSLATECLKPHVVQMGKYVVRKGIHSSLTVLALPILRSPVCLQRSNSRNVPADNLKRLIHSLSHLLTTNAHIHVFTTTHEKAIMEDPCTSLYWVAACVL